MTKASSKQKTKVKSKITISELDPSALNDLEFMFGPDMCLDCGHNDGFKVQHCLVKGDVETDDDFSELNHIVKKELGYSNFAQMTCHLGLVIIMSRCPKCGSENIADDCD